ncbi:MAG: hypothetical protein IT381_15000 [Deltaproteobacteria bacterium]|nr:hypothetical protein [Deltaproteobacteria bacterium]
MTTLLLSVLLSVDWASGVSTDALASYLSGDKLRIVIVASGEESPDLKTVTSLLEAKLKETKKTRVVVSSAALGKFTALDDEAIVKKCSKLPIDLVLVSRVFADAGTAMITVYDVQGTLQSAFTIEAGKALATKQHTLDGETKAAVAISNAIKAGDGAKGAQHAIGNEGYDSEFLWFDGQYKDRDGRVSQKWRPVLAGKYGKPVDPIEFYNRVERPDLADKYKSRKATKLGLGITGAIVVPAGVLMTVFGSLISPMPIRGACLRYIAPGNYYMCADYSYAPSPALPLLIVGPTAMAAGLSFIIAAIALKTHPITAAEGRELVDAHNSKLRERAEAGTRVSFDVPSVGITPNGVGFQWGGSF